MHHTKGKLEVICGSMFCGKSEELIRRVRRAHIAGVTTQLFKPALDTRTHHIQTHNGDSLTATALCKSTELFSYLKPRADVISIDEVQFFDSEIVLAIETLVERGKRVIVAGLDLDFRGLPFGCVPTLLALADEVTKLKAVCTRSGHDAHFTQRLIDGKPAKHTDPVVMIGASECYEARSRATFEIDHRPLKTYVEKIPSI